MATTELTRPSFKKGQEVTWETNGRGVKRTWTGTIVYKGKPYHKVIGRYYVRTEWTRKAIFDVFQKQPGMRKGINQIMADGIVVLATSGGDETAFKTPRLGSLTRV